MSEALGPGEKMERDRRQRRSFILIVLMAAGGVLGLVIAVAAPKGADVLQGALPAWAAVTAAAVWLVAVVGGSLWYKRHADEIDLAEQMWGMASACATIIILYPVWHLLWRARLVPAPDANVVFVALYVVMTCAYLWRKFH
ncbi:MAG TPA: hypothetical protein VGO55_10095 [Allosphingosinicella sp.]|nr:hypothetical protein [Allosphingosinicella sp.]